MTKTKARPAGAKAAASDFPPGFDRFKSLIDSVIEQYDNPLDGIEAIRDYLHQKSPNKSQPVDRVRWVPIHMVTPNDYNPNSVAKVEMGLLYHSIKSDGYTQPVVTVWNAERGLYEIVDGFHRYYTCKTNLDILARNNGRLPIVVIDKDINDRMASTVRHNRARGKHSVTGMSNMVFEMLDKGWSDAAICNELGMEPEELLRLKHITGFSKLFADVEYRRAWVTKNQIISEKAHDARPDAEPVGPLPEIKAARRAARKSNWSDAAYNPKAEAATRKAVNKALEQPASKAPATPPPTTKKAVRGRKKAT